jgi:hypothetical protein
LSPQQQCAVAIGDAGAPQEDAADDETEGGVSAVLPRRPASETSLREILVGVADDGFALPFPCDDDIVAVFDGTRRLIRSDLDSDAVTVQLEADNMRAGAFRHDSRGLDISRNAPDQFHRVTSRTVQLAMRSKPSRVAVIRSI